MVAFFKKHHKYILVVVLCCCMLSSLTVEAATSASWSFQIGNGGANIISYASESNPETYLVSSAEGIDTYNFKFTFTFPITLQFNQAAGADSSYRGGYVYGYFQFNIVMPVSITGLTGTKSNVRSDLQIELLQSDTVTVSNIYESRSGDSTSTRYIALFSNWSLPNLNNTSNRYLNLGQVKLTYEFEATVQPNPISAYITPSVTVPSSYMYCSAVAPAGQGIAGQIYSAIENSTSVEDIVTYLSLIEDAGGDINTAVANINEQLLPSVIGYLANIYTHTATMNQTTQSIRDYLYAISSTWPNYSAQVLFYLSQLVEMNQEQSSLAAEVESEYAAKASEGANLNQNMQVITPSVNQADFDINTNIDTGTMTTLSAFWAMFPRNSIIGTMFAIAIAGIAAGFFLYGKK